MTGRSMDDVCKLVRVESVCPCMCQQTAQLILGDGLCQSEDGVCRLFALEFACSAPPTAPYDRFI
jgi:hypothetical protein